MKRETQKADDWAQANQRSLMAELGRLGRLLRREPDEEAPATVSSSALDTLSTLFGLTSFERRIVLLCAGMELDGDFANSCAAAPGSGENPWPSFGLALASFPDAHWDALANNAPLRRWRLIEICGDGPLAHTRLRIDERLLFFLTGVWQLDARLGNLIEPLRGAAEISESQQTILDRLESAWKTALAKRHVLPALQLCGPDAGTKCSVAHALATRLTIEIFRLPAALLPVNLADLETLHRVWEREAILRNAALLLDCDRFETADTSHALAIDRWIELTRTPLLISTRDARTDIERPLLTVDVRRPTSREQRETWQSALGGDATRWNGQLERLVSQFDFSTVAICSTANSLGDKNASDLWEACRLRARPRLQDLAQHIVSRATWADIVLPAAQMSTLQTINLQVRHRARVCDEWGFAEKSNRGLGLSVLFAGPSGTGKTLAAEILANELELDLFRIDLSAVVSKYIGETEKNLRRVFDAAEEGGAVLLFDEADALFGKRSEVKDSHDRYANVEVSYLLQRMEAYRGLAILATNMKEALDPAFLRRLRFVVQFPFPDQAQRTEIWRRIFPGRTPTRDLDLGALGRLSISGGNIRSIALNAAFGAAESNTPVQMHHLLEATRLEYAKLEKPITDAELGGWK
jgi:ATPase family protein associated with various cellular activities (AAA)/winged helix domain-containing protein